MTIQDKKDFAEINFEECHSLRKTITHQGKGIVSFTSLKQNKVVTDLAIEIAKVLCQQNFKILLIVSDNLNPTLKEWLVLTNNSVDDPTGIRDLGLMNRVPVTIEGKYTLDVLTYESTPELREYLSSDDLKNKLIDSKSTYDYIVMSLPSLNSNYETREILSISNQSYVAFEMMMDDFRGVSATLQSLQLTGITINGWISINRRSKKYPYFGKLFNLRSK